MHPALSIENLSHLPGRYKVMAKSAANGSLRDLTRLSSYLDNLGAANCQLLLPIFYSSLEPAGIPPAAGLDQPTSALLSDNNDCCGRAAMSLNCVAHLTQIVNVFSPDLAAEFWPRIWAWIQFLYTHRDAVPVVVAADPATTYSTYGYIIAHFVPDHMDATPELRLIITAVWKVLLGVRGDFQEATYVLLSQLIIPLGMTEPTGIILTDLVEGAGGTLHDLAFLLVRHIRCAVWTPQSVVSPSTLSSMLFDGTRVIGNICGSDPVNSALLSCGVVKAAIRALHSLIHSGLSSQSADTTLCFVLHPLLYFLNISPGYPTVRRALKAGLLQLILDAAQQSETVSMYLKRLLTQILTPATVYRSVLLNLQKALADVVELERSLAFRESRIFPEWSQFAALANTRIRLMEEYNAGQHPSRKGCRNMNCGLINQKIEFFRCSVCKDAYYCSVDCQAADWGAGHQQSCHELSLARLQRIGTRSKRDTSFLCTLMHIDYQRSREAILIQHMFEGRGNSPTFSTVRFDYTAPDGLQLTAAQTSRPVPITAGEREEERRISRGRTQHHHVVVAEGAAKASLIFPMHISNPDVRDNLRRLSNALPEGGDHNLLSLGPAVRDEITALLAVKVEEMH
ncbi:MYND-type domain-containing protein [Mycena venus]|uniref:MYND-type domain-containing protein n=1 Tax=Mycena venus TaxID=2733690 RepID=A0A8H6XKZ5_9AGAR|nr:MYND-type domain-containing protein [Mycena venus]